MGSMGSGNGHRPLYWRAPKPHVLCKQPPETSLFERALEMCPISQMLPNRSPSCLSHMHKRTHTQILDGLNVHTDVISNAVAKKEKGTDNANLQTRVASSDLMQDDGRIRRKTLLGKITVF